MTRRRWSDSELAVLCAMYPYCASEDIGALLGRAAGSVYQAAAARGWKKSDEYMSSVSSGRTQRGRQHPAVVNTCFKPGMTPWNKGKPYHAGGRSVQTQFQKGERKGAALKNFVPIGTYRINSDGILQQKVTTTGYPPKDWRSVALVRWEAEHGPVPAGHIVVFRPGQRTTNPDLLTIDRLECISRAENAKRNHPANRSPELAKLIQLKGAITRQMRRIERESHGTEPAHHATASTPVGHAGRPSQQGKANGARPRPGRRSSGGGAG